MKRIARPLFAVFVLFTLLASAQLAQAATVIWRGDAPAVKQVSTVQITANDVNTSYRITINGKIVAVNGNAGGVNSTATDLKTALDASTIPEFDEAVWTVNADTVTGTAATAGKPFTATSSVSGGTGTIGAVTTTTSSSGPNHFDTAANWSGGAVPVNADDIVFENSSIDCLYGLDQNAVAPTSVTIRSTYTGKLGLARITSTGYVEYRQRYYKSDIITLNVGDAAGGAGSGRLLIDLDGATATVNVYSTGLSAETGLGALVLKNTNASTLNVFRGTVSVAPQAGETANFATGVRIGIVQGAANSVATVYCGSGVTLGTITQDGGTLTTHSNITTINMTGGEHVREAGTTTTANIRGGTYYGKSTGSISTLTISSTGTVDFSRDNRTKTVSTCNAYKGATIRDPSGAVVFTAGIDLGEGTRVQDVVLDVGATGIKVNP